ncbi:1-deoxy-D-xylulose-5-phosphate synthase [Merdibacter massiliensis]|uniref:1-deoxy-D-xylulose-5-phosphate synthase n=1 Tax=Merdibacter massiliensis TaxID=1871030 RepID=UPI00096A8E91|nr:1-deoxy-D-xylulose-5-phosphate synthase [Merdibacter massiliensis]
MHVYDIRGPQDIKHMTIDELNELAQEIRDFLISSISKTGGHLSSNLGVVELTIALHYVFHSPKDKILFDVGHQSYVHKILTGRSRRFSTLRQYKGLSGFQKRYESEHDCWEAGHSSTSLSAALGMAVARDLNGDDYQVIPVIGDGAMASGMSMEALNQIGGEQRNMIIIFNDNSMSISQNVGAMDIAFTKLRTSRPYAALKSDLQQGLSGTKVGRTVLKGMKNVKNAIKENVVDTSIFGEFNLDYIGPINGHDLASLIKVLEASKRHKGPIVIHVLTKKGKGYPYAENDKEGTWHGVSQFDPKTGQSLAKLPAGHCSWSEIISRNVCDLARKNRNIVTITPAMKSGSKLNNFATEFPNRFFDCGIAEEHAMTFAAGLAANGKRPFLSIYSAFLQRAYDQLNHDVARMDLPVVIGIDRCGLVGEDGPTHHGVFDITMLHSLPNLILSQPKDAIEARALLQEAFSQDHPFCIRYPRGSALFACDQHVSAPIGTWTSYCSSDTIKVCVVTYGTDVDRILAKAKANEMPIEVINARYFKPMDEEMLDYILYRDIPIIVYESDMLDGGLSCAMLQYINDHDIHKHLIRMGIRDHFVEQGSIAQLRKAEKIDINSLFRKIEELLTCV